MASTLFVHVHKWWNYIQHVQETEAQISTDDDTQHDIDHTRNYLKTTVPRDELSREGAGDDSNQRWYHGLNATSAVIGCSTVYIYFLTNNILSKAENSELITNNTCGWITHGRSWTPAAEMNVGKGCNAVTRAMVYSKYRILYSSVS